MPNLKAACFSLIAMLLLAPSARSQPRVSEANWGERIILIVPIVGAGTAADPKRPDLIPPASDFLKLGISSYRSELSADGRTAIVEIIASRRSAIDAIAKAATGRPEIKTFERGKSGRSDTEKAARDAEKTAFETEAKRLKADFDIDRFVQGNRGTKQQEAK